jgi:hypothetical protein
MLKTILLASLTMMCVTSCALGPRQVAAPVVTQPVIAQTRIVDAGCDWIKPIYPDDADVDVISMSLARQVSDHNKMGAKRCGWIKPGSQQSSVK